MEPSIELKLEIITPLNGKGRGMSGNKNRGKKTTKGFYRGTGAPTNPVGYVLKGGCIVKRPKITISYYCFK